MAQEILICPQCAGCGFLVGPPIYNGIMPMINDGANYPKEVCPECRGTGYVERK